MSNKFLNITFYSCLAVAVIRLLVPDNFCIVLLTIVYPSIGAFALILLLNNSDILSVTDKARNIILCSTALLIPFTVLTFVNYRNLFINLIIVFVYFLLLGFLKYILCYFLKPDTASVISFLLIIFIFIAVYYRFNEGVLGIEEF